MTTMQTINRAGRVNGWVLPTQVKAHVSSARWYIRLDELGAAETAAQYATFIESTGCADLLCQAWNSASAAGYISSIVPQRPGTTGTEIADVAAEFSGRFHVLFPVVKGGTGVPAEYGRTTVGNNDYCDPYDVGFQDWIVALAAEVAAVPEVDGLCMDFIRYPVDDGRNHEVPIRQIVEKISAAVRAEGKGISSATHGWFHDTEGGENYFQGNRAADWVNDGLTDRAYCFDYKSYGLGGTDGDPPNWPAFVEYQSRFDDPTKCISMGAAYEVSGEESVPNTDFRPVVTTINADLFGSWSYFADDDLTDANAALLS